MITLLQNKPGDIVRFCGESWLSNKIRKVTGDDTTHVGLLLSYVNEIEDWLIAEAYEGGDFLDGIVDVNLLQRRLNNYSGKCYISHLDPDLDIYRDSICSTAWDSRRINYDYWTLFRNVLGRQDFDISSFICSELVQHCLNRGIPREVLANYPMNESTELLFKCEICMIPGDFEDLTIIYEHERIR